MNCNKGVATAYMIATSFSIDFILHTLHFVEYNLFLTQSYLSSRYCNPFTYMI